MKLKNPAIFYFDAPRLAVVVAVVVVVVVVVVVAEL